MVEIDRTQIVGDFLRGAITDPNDPIGRIAKRQGVYLASHPDKHLKTLGINLLGIYYAFPKSTYVEIGQAYGITSERVRQVIEKSTLQIWEFSSMEFKNKYPLRDLIDKGRAKKLRGDTAKALTLNLEGKNLLEIKKELGLTRTRTYQIIDNLEKRGVSIGKFEKKKDKILDTINNSTDDEEIQLLLNKIDRSMYTQIKKSHPNTLVTVKNLVQSLGFHPSNGHVNDFAASLKRSDIPIGEVNISSHDRKGGTYQFTTYKYSDRASEVLLNNPDFDKYKHNPVTLIYGPVNENVPNIWELRNSGRYTSIKKVLETLGIHFGGRNAPIIKEHFLTNECPVQVFNFKTANFVNTKDEAALTDFFKTRLMKLKE